MFRIALGNASSSGAPTSRMNPGEADQPDAAAQELLRNGAVELVTRRETSMVDDQRLDARAGRTRQSGGARRGSR